MQDTLVGRILAEAERPKARAWWVAIGVDNLRGGYLQAGARLGMLSAFAGFTHEKRVFSGLEVRF